MGSRGREDSRQGGTGGPSKVADCGTGQAGQLLADPVAPHSPMDKLGGTAGEQNSLSNPGLQLGEIKPQTYD